MPDPASSSSLSLRTKLAFGVGASAEAALHIAFVTFSFLFYNNVLGLPGTLCGLAVTIALVFDAVTDPLIGSISDRWHSRFGRRHPFLFAAALPTALCFACIFLPPEGLQGFPLFLWFTVFTVLFRSCLTLYHVPHLALGAELSPHYSERSVVMSYNALFGVVGGASTFFLGWSYFARLEGGTSFRPGYAALAGVVAVFAAVTVLLSAFFTRDQIPRLSKVLEDLPPFTPAQTLREMGGCLANRNYLHLLFGLFFLSAMLGTRETLNSYVNLFFWELSANQIRFYALASPPGYVAAFILAARLHDRFDKRETIIGSICGTVLAASLPIGLRLTGNFPSNGTPWLLPCLLIAHCAFYACMATLNISVMSALADVADEHELRTGRRQEGIFYSARTFFSKLTSGLGHLLAGIAIDVIRFPSGAIPGQVDGEVLFKLGLVDGPIASIPAAIAILFYARYRIDKKRHAQVRAALDAEQAGKKAFLMRPGHRSSGSRASAQPSSTPAAG